MAPKHKGNKNDPKRQISVNIRETSAISIADPIVAGLSTAGVTDEERHQLISEAAYFKAEQRSFAPGNELEDWLTAEREIEQRLSSIVIGNLPKSS